MTLETSNIIKIKAGAIRKLCESVKQYRWHRGPEQIIHSILPMLEFYNDHDLFPMPEDEYSILLNAEKK